MPPILQKLYQQLVVAALCGLTILVFVFGAINIHVTRQQASRDQAKAQAQQAKYEGQISSLQSAVNTGNKSLSSQRKAFLSQFVNMSKRVEKLQTEVATSDLQKEAASLLADLDATRRSMERPKATLQFSFVDKEPFNGVPSHVDFLEETGGKIHVRFTVVNLTDANALDGDIILRVCSACKIVGTSPGFSHLEGSPATQRNFAFTHIFAHTDTQIMNVTVVPPPNVNSFQVGIEYRCRNCELPNGYRKLPASDIGTVVLGPHIHPFSGKGRAFSGGESPRILSQKRPI